MTACGRASDERTAPAAVAGCLYTAWSPQKALEARGCGTAPKAQRRPSTRAGRSQGPSKRLRASVGPAAAGQGPRWLLTLNPLDVLSTAWIAVVTSLEDRDGGLLRWTLERMLLEPPAPQECEPRRRSRDACIRSAGRSPDLLAPACGRLRNHVAARANPRSPGAANRPRRRCPSDPGVLDSCRA